MKVVAVLTDPLRPPLGDWAGECLGEGAGDKEGLGEERSLSIPGSLADVHDVLMAWLPEIPKKPDFWIFAL